MTDQERKLLAKENARQNLKFEKKHFPRVKKQLDKVVSSLIGTIKREGVNEAVVLLRTQLWSDKLYKPLQDIYKQVGVYHANETYKRIRQEIGEKSRSETWVQYILGELNRTLVQFGIVKTSETLRNHMLVVIEKAIKKGKTQDELIEILTKSGFTSMQALRIVRTEVGRAANTGVKAAALGFNYEMVKEWIAFRDQRTRGFRPKQPKDHYHMDGQVVDFFENFTDPRSGEQIEYPLAPEGSPGMVINCRCSYVIVPKRDSRGRLIRR